MKIRTLLPLLSLFLLWGSFSLKAQEKTPPEIVYEQGKIIGSLPYGRHFFIIGDSKLPNGAVADKVQVQVWPTGAIKFRRNQELPDPPDEILAALEQKEPLIMAEWTSSKAKNPEQFRLYINTTLRPRTEYFVRFSYFKSQEFLLTEEEKQEILLNTTARAISQFRISEQITGTELKDIINDETQSILERRLNLSENQFLEGSNLKRNDILPDISFDAKTLLDLSEILGKMASKKRLIELNNNTIANEIKPVLDEGPEADSLTYATALEEQKTLEKENLERRAEIDSLRLVMVDRMEVIRRQLVRVVSELSLLQPNAYSVSELDAVNIGTSFGGSVVGLNMTNRDQRAFDVFSYSAVKFHLLPVDKSINEPYLDVFFINRLSFLVGISFAGNINYNGDELEPAMGFFPILGGSYDFSRYFSIDIGATLFEQNELGGLSNAKKLRVGPVLGISFDFDLLNRFQSTFSGEKYITSPTN